MSNIEAAERAYYESLEQAPEYTEEDCAAIGHRDIEIKRQEFEDETVILYKCVHCGRKEVR